MMTFSILLTNPLAQAQETDVGNEAIIEGKVVILHVDEFERGKSRFVYFIEEKQTKDWLELDFPNKPPKGLKPEQKIKARGRAMGKKFQVEEITEEPQTEPSTEIQENTIQGAGQSKNAIVMVVNMSTSPNYFDANTVTSVESTMFSASNSMDNLYLEASFGQLSFPGDQQNNVVLVEIPYTENCPYYTFASAADTAATDAGIDLSQFQHKVYLLPPSSISGCSWLALGQLGTYGTNSTLRSWSTKNDSIAFAHEVGHNLGFHHAATDLGNDGTMDKEYGDTSDLMGYCCSKRKLNSVHVDQIGWYKDAILAGSVVNVLSNGTYSLAPLGTDPSTTTHPQILKIDKTDSSETYYLSYRQQTGLDAGMASKYTTGVSIHRGKESGQWSYELAVLNSDTNNQFVDSINGITVTQLSNDTNAVTIEISFDNCVRNAPTVSVGPTTQLISDLGDGSGIWVDPAYTVTVTNNDSQGCTGTDFVLREGELLDSDNNPISAAILFDFENTAMHLPPGNSSSTSLNVQIGNVMDDNFTFSVETSAADTADHWHHGSGSASIQVDTTPPNPPTSLSVAAKGKKMVELNWQPATDGNAGTGIQYYSIFRNGTWIGDTTSTLYQDKDFSKSGTNDYWVTATDRADHTSFNSETVSYQNGGGSDSDGGSGGKGGGKGRNK